MEPEIVRYVPGQPIDTQKILEVVGLTEEHWAAIEEAYPEIKTAGPNAPFRSEKKFTIFPPQRVSRNLLYTIVSGGHRAYPHPNRTHPTSVLVYSAMAYPEIHIYRPWLIKKRQG